MSESIEELKNLTVKGNALDKAGVVVGMAFNKVAHSPGKEILIPPIGFLAGDADFMREERKAVRP